MTIMTKMNDWIHWGNSPYGDHAGSLSRLPDLAKLKKNVDHMVKQSPWKDHAEAAKQRFMKGEDWKTPIRIVTDDLVNYHTADIRVLAEVKLAGLKTIYENWKAQLHYKSALRDKEPMEVLMYGKGTWASYSWCDKLGLMSLWLLKAAVVCAVLVSSYRLTSTSNFGADTSTGENNVIWSIGFSVIMALMAAFLAPWLIDEIIKSTTAVAPRLTRFINATFWWLALGSLVIFVYNLLTFLNGDFSSAIKLTSSAPPPTAGCVLAAEIVVESLFSYMVSERIKNIKKPYAGVARNPNYDLLTRECKEIARNVNLGEELIAKYLPYLPGIEFMKKTIQQEYIDRVLTYVTFKSQTHSWP